MNDDEAICMILCQMRWNKLYTRICLINSMIWQRVTYLEKCHIKPILNERNRIDSKREQYSSTAYNNSIILCSQPMIKRANDTEKAKWNEGLKITVHY